MASAKDITEFRNLVDNFRKPEPLIRKAIRALMQQQFLFADDRGCRDLYNIVTDYECTSFFEAYFAVMGYELVVNRQGRMVALMPPSQTGDDEATTMRTDETIAMLLCRARFDEAIQTGDLKNGDAPWHTDALYGAWREATGREPPLKGRMLEILRQLKTRNMISGVIPQAMPEGFAFGVRPSVALAVTGEAALLLTERARTKVKAEERGGGGDAAADGDEEGQE